MNNQQPPDKLQPTVHSHEDRDCVCHERGEPRAGSQGTFSKLKQAGNEMPETSVALLPGWVKGLRLAARLKGAKRRAPVGEGASDLRRALWLQHS